MNILGSITKSRNSAITIEIHYRCRCNEPCTKIRDKFDNLILIALMSPTNKPTFDSMIYYHRANNLIESVCKEEKFFPFCIFLFKLIHSISLRYITSYVTLFL